MTACPLDCHAQWWKSSNASGIFLLKHASPPPPAIVIQANAIAVPKYQARKAGKEAEWQEAMRFQQRDAGGASAAKRAETDDEYLSRLQGCLAFYAAVLQSSVPGNPLGPGQAWQYLSRCACLWRLSFTRMFSPWISSCRCGHRAMQATLLQPAVPRLQLTCSPAERYPWLCVGAKWRAW